MTAPLRPSRVDLPEAPTPTPERAADGTTVKGEGEPEGPCPGGGYDPNPTAVAVEAVPIVVESTTADYFVLYVEHDVDGTEVELPVLVDHRVILSGQRRKLEKGGQQWSRKGWTC